MLQFVTDTVPVSSSLLDDSLHVGDVSQEQSNVQHALRRRLLGGIQVHVQIWGRTSLKNFSIHIRDFKRSAELPKGFSGIKFTSILSVPEGIFCRLISRQWTRNLETGFEQNKKKQGRSRLKSMFLRWSLTKRGQQRLRSTPQEPPGKVWWGKLWLFSYLLMLKLNQTRHSSFK